MNLQKAQSKYIAFFLILFAMFSTFGIITMRHGERGEKDAHACAASMVSGKECPSANPVERMAFHLTVFKESSTAISSQAFVELLTVILFLWFGFHAFRRLFDSRTKTSTWRRYTASPRVVQLSLLRWLAIHENSPGSIWDRASSL